MKRLLSINLPRALGVSALGMAVVVAAEPPESAEVAAAMGRMVDAREVAGAVTLVAAPDRILHLGATGFSNLARHEPLSTDAFFWIASMTKPFMSVSILMLQDEHKLSVDEPVEKYLPKLGALKTSTGERAHITIAQLLSHTSGLPEIDRAVYHAATTLDQVASHYSPAKLQFDPGHGWKYTSVNFDLAARIVEQLSGESFDQFLAERLFAPLGMRDTTFYPTDAQWARLAGCYARDRATGELRPQPQAIGRPMRGHFAPLGAGGLFSTASDIGRFCQMLLGRGQLESRRYLSPDAVAALAKIQTGSIPTGFVADRPEPVLGWGLGVFVVRARDDGASAFLSVGSFGHAGANGTDMIIDPVAGRAYVVMVQRPNLPNNFNNPVGRAFLAAAVPSSTGRSPVRSAQ
jgi:CubicO group peptidase (beta-lactamase class C family)